MGSYVLAPRNAQYMFKAATPKQIGFIKSLMDDRVMDDEHRHWLLCQIEEGSLSSKEASLEIDSLLKKPKIAKQKVEHTAPKVYVEAVEEAYYVNEAGTFFQPKRSKAGHLYAMELRPHGKKFKWVYSPGAMKDFQNWKPVTAEIASQFGKAWGHCMVCARLLTNPDSIEAGIGPICAGKF
jgi:hypothetical protein